MQLFPVSSSAPHVFFAVAEAMNDIDVYLLYNEEEYLSHDNPWYGQPVASNVDDTKIEYIIQTKAGIVIRESKIKVRTVSVSVRIFFFYVT